MEKALYCRALTKNGYNNKLSFVTCVKYTYAAYHFLSYAAERLQSINELNNHVVDSFLVNYGHRVSHLRQLIIWINKNKKLFVKIKLPQYYRKPYMGDFYDNETLSKIMVSLLSVETSYRDKMVGLLNLFYAIRPREIAQLKLNNYIKHKNTSLLYIRGKNLMLDSFISDCIDKYILFERNSSLSFGTNEDWLLPGYNYTKPLSLDLICSILRKHNINSNMGFDTVIANYLIDNQSSPSIIIKGLGLNINTVITHYKQLNIDSMNEIDDGNYSSNSNNSLSREKILNNVANYHIYILRCSDSSYYTGYTSDLQRRLQQHQNGTGCTYTKTRTPVELVYTEELPDKPSALKREKQIKKLTIFDKEKLIEKSRVN